MRKHAWWLVGTAAAVFWSLCAVFTLAAWGEGEMEPADARLWGWVNPPGLGPGSSVTLSPPAAILRSSQVAGEVMRFSVA